MECPNCHRQVKAKERVGYVCSKCKQPFALDPKENTARLHDVRLNKITEQLRQDGTWHYTLDQVLYRALYKNAKKQHKQSLLGYGIISLFLFTPISILLCAMIGIPYNFAIWVIGAILVLVLVFMLWKQRPTTYPLSHRDSLAHMQQSVVERWQKVYGVLPKGMIRPRSDRSKIPATGSTSSQVRAVVTSPNNEVLRCLLENHIPERLNIFLLPLSQKLPSAPQQAMLQQLQQNPRLPLIVLHDASAEDYLLLQKVIEILGLHEQHRVIDAGLYPSVAIQEKMLMIRLPRKERPQKPLIVKLEAYVVDTKNRQEVDVKNLQNPLTPKELKMLKKFSTPILCLSSIRIAKMVQDALNLASPTSSSRDSATIELQSRTPQQEAEAVGFMSFPPE